MKMLIDGRKVDSRSRETIEVSNPVNNELVDTVPSASKEDVEDALDASMSGKTLWANTPLHERSSALMRFVALVGENKKALAELMCMEMGKRIAECEMEIDDLTDAFTGYTQRANHVYGHVLPSGAESGSEKDLIFTIREPLGLIVCIVPFNFPCELFAHKVAPALAMGNAVIVKPASDNPLTVTRLVELLWEAGIPGNGVQLVTGRGSQIGQWLCTSPKVDAISFTGSTEVGREIARKAGENLTRVFLELGGNDPLIIFADTDLELAVEEAVTARILNAGQTCSAPKRFIIEHDIYDEFAERLVHRLKNIRMGQPMDRETGISCVISERAADDIVAQIESAVGQGAQCIYGGKKIGRSSIEPTVLLNVTKVMDVASDLEIFGPVFPLMRFHDAEEAVEIANNTMYGLSAGIMSKDTEKAFRIASRIHAGTVVVNGSGDYRTSAMAFGGYKMSGIGREGSSYTLEEMSQLKNLVAKNVF